jgi:acyl-CoA thioesterase-1
MKKIITLAIIILIPLFGFGLYYFFRAEAITNYPSKGKDIIAFGDSLVVGVGSTPSNDFITQLSKKIGQPIINLGRSGDTTADGLVRVSELDKYNPKIVIILLGGNDYLKKIPTEETHKNLTSIIERVQTRGAIVLLLGVQGGVFRDNFKAEFKKLRDTYHTAFVPNILDSLIGNPKYMYDYVHPNDIGYGLIVDRVYPVLKKIIN